MRKVTESDAATRLMGAANAFAAETRAITSLIPYARNSRTHSDSQVAQIAASIKEWGFTSPVLIDETNTILAGHGRTMAAKKLGMTEVPVIVAKNWTEAQKRAYVIADNKLAMNAGWDSELLAVEMQDLAGMDFDVLKTGFEGDELAALLGDIKVSDLDDDEPPAALERKFLVLVEVANESEQATLFEEFQTRGLKTRVMD
jgi:ParB-like chromosome segregation protein Spo0J